MFLDKYVQVHLLQKCAVPYNVINFARLFYWEFKVKFRVFSGNFNLIFVVIFFFSLYKQKTHTTTQTECIKLIEICGNA